jgi:hypothetical protein
VSFVEQFGRPLVKEDLLFSAVGVAPGQLWVGTLGGGLRRIDGRGATPQDTRHLTQLDGLPSNLVVALAVGPDGALWAATDKGVSRLREAGDTVTLTIFAALDGLALPVRDVAVDAQGTAWLATNGGLFRILPQGGRLQGVVLDSVSQPVEGVDVIVQGTPFRAVTDAAGRFVLANLPLGPQHLLIDASLAVRGPFTLVERDVVVTPESPSLEIVVAAPVQGRQLVRVSGEGQTAVVGTTLPLPLEVAVQDSQGHPVPGTVVIFTILTGNGALASPTVTTGTDGRAATVVTVGTTAGVNRVEARAVGLAPVIFTATGNADRATARLIQVSGNNQVGNPGEELPEPLVVRLEDQFRNPVSAEPVRATIVKGTGTILSDSSPSPSQSQASATIETDAQGQAAFRLQPEVNEGVTVVAVEAPALPQVAPVQFIAVVGFLFPVDIAIEGDGHLVLRFIIDAQVMLPPPAS